MRLEPGDQAPDFTLPDQDGQPFTLSESLAQRQCRHVVYFYPKDDTSGCTKEACQFNESLASFRAAQVPVIGISPDPVDRHVRFRTKYGLEFPLLSDPDHVVMEQYGAWGEKTMYGKKTTGVIRSTFLIGPDGRVESAWYNVRADGHAAKVLAEVGA
jgi:peroxiredoxin Q/BCP